MTSMEPNVDVAAVARPGRRRSLRVLAVIDAHQLTGPAKQVLGSLSRLGPGTTPAIGVIQRTPGETPLAASVRGAGLPCVVFRERFRLDPRPAVRLARYLRRAEIDVLETHGYKANVLGGIVATLLRVPWIAFLHGETHEGGKVRMYFALERMAARRAPRVVVVSRAMRELAIRWAIPAERIRVIHNACFEAADAAADGRSVSAPVIGIVGRLSREKGVDVALRAHARVVMTQPGARMIIAGVGPEEAKLAALASTLGVAGSVEWLGYEADIKSVFSRLMLLVLPSRSEGLPNVVLESMAYGVPVVATAVGGVPEAVIDGDTGVLVAPEDDVSIAAAVVNLLQDADRRRRLAEHARQAVAQRFSAAGRVRKLKDTYAEVTS
jgi:glycosyltransferase involved in cell wall biosynthesis